PPSGRAPPRSLPAGHWRPLSMTCGASARPVSKCSARAQLLCLPDYLRQGDLATRVSYAWTGLSRACHHHVYELPPTAAELDRWIGTVEELANALADALPTGGRARYAEPG
ncbi:MAG: hypothetical protein ACREMA_16710, partial [Longimicrobiales bacterium]